MIYDTEAFVSKPQSIRLESDGNTIALRQNLKLEPGKKYKISFSVKIDKVVPKVNPGGVVLNICDGKNYWFPSKWLTGTADWTKYEGTFTTGEKVVNSYLLLYLNNSSGTAWFDNVTFEKID